MAAVAVLSACGADEATEPLPGGGGSGGGQSLWTDTVRVEPGQSFAIRVEPSGELVPDAVPDPLSELPGAVADAVGRVPAPFRQQLARTLWQLPVEAATRLAEEILAAEEPWVDEVGWAMAVTDPAILSWILERGDEGLFVENAEGVYAVDGQLAYASLVELDDGRTSVELDGENGPFQLEPEEYYWYVVYPRAFLELPAYEGGTFWRTFFREDATYGSTLLEAVAAATSLQEAAYAVGEWIQSFMTFGYGTNDLWPIEIYEAQYGSCGQYSILTTAAAKTVLVPTVSVSARADDHEWNELWDGRWIMWDNSLGEIGSNPQYPYLDWPEIFDDDTYNGAGVLGEVAHTFRFRGDEYIWPSDLYTEQKNVYVDVTDGEGRPVAGARVVARTAASDFLECTWSSTDQDGRASLLLGDDIAYGFSASHDILGALPVDGNVTISVVTTGDPAEYVDALVYETTCPRAVVDVGVPPSGDRELVLSFQVERTDQRQRNVITEPYELGQTYPSEFDGGLLDVFVVDEEGKARFDAQQPFDGHAVTLAARAGTVEIALPADETWYVVLDNTWWPLGAKHVAIDLAVSW